ncbi:T9SS type A sorting domain-containing protein [Nonlabens ulvanivorans]|uniref:T9SS type A sorting domain-containing protein n=1 Tax=Nonlabens ulvanivorans TaxID=906888 RepID=UPI0037C627D9
MKKILLLVAFCAAFVSYGQTTVSYDFSSSGAQSGLNVSSPGVALDANIGFGSFKNSGSSNPGIFSNQLRLYQNATKGGSIIIYPSNGVIITDITINASGTTGNAGYSVDGGAVVNLSSSTAYVISGISATSQVEFFQRDSSSSNRIYVDTFDVTYMSAGPSTTTLQFDPNSLIVNEDAGTVDLTVSISNESATTATTADVVLTSGTASSIGNYMTQALTFPAGSSTNQTVTVTVTDDMLVEMDENFVFELQNIQGGDSAAAGLNSQFTLTVLEDDVAPISLPYTESFDDCANNAWVAYDQAGDDEWICGSGAYTMNGFGGTEDIDWLITEVPVSFPVMASINQIEVTTSERFGNAINESGEFLLRYSTDYDGSGDPTTATWTDLVFDPNNTSSGSSPSASSTTVVDASAIQGEAYIAFLYDNTGLGAEEWVLEEIEITTLPANTNLAPTVTNISNSPLVPASTETVTINADVTDADGLASVVLEYGFATGVYDQPSEMMSLTSGDTYTAVIDAQADGTTVYYQIVATDANTAPETTTSSEQSYTVTDPQPQGLQVDMVDTNYLIDFDNTVPNVNNGAFNGSGFATVPTAGQLDADAFAITGLQDGTTSFGDEQSGNDFGKGTSDGGVNSGGIYAFEVAPGDFALGVQPTGSDFTPGTIHFQFTNNTGVTITDLSIAYDFYVLDNENRANDFRFSHGSDINSLNEITDVALTSMLGQDLIEEWKRNLIALDLTGLNIASGATYVLAWSSADSGSNSSDEIALDNIQILANPSSETIVAEGIYESMTLLSSVSLIDEAQLNSHLKLVSGNLITNDQLTFNSIDGKSAVIEEVISGSITGDVTVEQFYPAQRAFRFVSSPVNMTGTIFDNWQQGGLNPGDAGYLAGIGTQITGGTSGGFDISGSNNPSAFTFSNDGTQVWQTPTATDDMNASLSAGTPYRLFIRGDRSIDLTISDMPNDTKLITTGELKLNDAIQTFDASLSTGDFVFAGNPYQAKVDVGAMIFDMATRTQEDMNPNFMYVWNPQAGTRGAYRAYDFRDSTSTPTDGEVAGELQPGQSMFLQILNDADSDVPSVTFKESYKVSGSNLTSTFSVPQGFLTLDVYNSNATALDGLKINFDLNGLDIVDSFDLLKIENLDENISIINNSNRLAIESRSNPTDGTIIPLEIKRFNDGNYDFKTRLSGVNNLNTYLHDAHTNQYHLIAADVMTTISLNFDSTVPSTVALDRFSIYFSNVTLSELDVVRTDTISMYPNPVIDGSLQINGLSNDTESSVQIHNLSGQLLIRRDFEAHNGQVILTNLDNLNMGVYLLTIQQGNNSFVERIVIK